MTEEDKINDAIVNHLSILLTDKSVDSIKSLYGNEVYTSINEIIAFAGNDIIWANNDDLKSHDETMERVKKEYPFLSHTSIIKIADAAAYFWKSN